MDTLIHKATLTKSEVDGKHVIYVVNFSGYKVAWILAWSVGLGSGIGYGLITIMDLALMLMGC